MLFISLISVIASPVFFTGRGDPAFAYLSKEMLDCHAHKERELAMTETKDKGREQ